MERRKFILVTGPVVIGSSIGADKFILGKKMAANLLPHEKEVLDGYYAKMAENLKKIPSVQKPLDDFFKPVQILHRSNLDQEFSLKFQNQAGNYLTFNSTEVKTTLHISDQADS